MINTSKLKRPVSSVTSSSSLISQDESEESSEYSPSPASQNLLKHEEEVEPNFKPPSTPSSTVGISGALTPSPKKFKPNTKLKNQPKTTPKKTVTPKKEKSEVGGSKITHNSGTNGTWDGEKRGLLIDEIINAGYKSVNLDELASKLGMSKRQLVDQLVPNKNNLRGKMVMVAKGM